MAIIDGCCCFESLKNGAKGSAVFTFVTGVINIIIDICLLVGLHRLNASLEPNEKFIWMPPGILVFMYIELCFNFVVLVLGFALWIGVNQGYDGKFWINMWTYGMISFRVYHMFLLIYVLTWIGGHRVSDVIYMFPVSFLVSIYWLLNTIILIAAIICVISYWQELCDELYGKERRIKYFHKLANIRSAASYTNGSATPRTGGSYYGGSHMAMSQVSHVSLPPKY